MKFSDKKVRHTVLCAIIAALYATLTLLTQSISFGPLQLRIAEMLTVLPYFSPSAVAGLTLGCFISNIASPYGIIDMFFGSLATLIASYLTMLCGKLKLKFLAPLPPVLINGIIIGLLLAYESGNFTLQSFLSFFISVSAGQIIPCFSGLALIFLIEKNKKLNEILR